MKITIKDPIKENNITETYKVDITTMTGDGDNYHHIIFYYQNIIDVTVMVEMCEELLKVYPYGKGGGDDYDHLDFFDEFFADKWYYEDGQYCDLMDEYKITYFDENGKEYNVDVEL